MMELNFYTQHIKYISKCFNSGIFVETFWMQKSQCWIMVKDMHRRFSPKWIIFTKEWMASFNRLRITVCSRDFPGREFPGNHGFSRENSREQKIDGISREFPGKFPGFCSFSRFPGNEKSGKLQTLNMSNLKMNPSWQSCWHFNGCRRFWSFGDGGLS